MSDKLTTLATALERAGNEGYEDGKAAASWLLDGNSTDQDAWRLLKGIRDGDPEIMDSLPSSPLSGEFAGDKTPEDVLSNAGVPTEEPYSDAFDEEAREEILDAYEAGFNTGAHDGAETEARSALGLIIEAEVMTSVWVITFTPIPGYSETVRAYTTEEAAFAAMMALPDGCEHCLLREAPLDPTA